MPKISFLHILDDRNDCVVDCFSVGRCCRAGACTINTSRLLLFGIRYQLYCIPGAAAGAAVDMFISFTAVLVHCPRVNTNMIHYSSRHIFFGHVPLHTGTAVDMFISFTDVLVHCPRVSTNMMRA